MPKIEGSEVFSHADYKDGHLHLTFHSGKTHAYPVSEEQYQDFLSADSKGKWFHRHITAKKISGKKIE